MYRFRLMCVAAIVVLQACTGEVSRGQEKQSAAAQTIRNSKALSWTVTYYQRITSEDGQRSWLQANRSTMDYRSPDRYRDTRYDADDSELVKTPPRPSINIVE